VHLGANPTGGGGRGRFGAEGVGRWAVVWPSFREMHGDCHEGVPSWRQGGHGIESGIHFVAMVATASKAVSISSPWWPRHRKWYPIRRHGGHGIKSGIQFDAVVATASKAVSNSSPWWPRHRKRYPFRRHGGHGIKSGIHFNAVGKFFSTMRIIFYAMAPRGLKMTLEFLGVEPRASL
jgi:hypothetical protein